MSDDTHKGSGPGTTSDPNQANLTGRPGKSETRGGDVTPDPTPDDPKTGPGTTSDPNQADRT